jgi:hypothetical protein
MTKSTVATIFLNPFVQCSKISWNNPTFVYNVLFCEQVGIPGTGTRFELIFLQILGSNGLAQWFISSVKKKNDLLRSLISF